MMLYAMDLAGQWPDTVIERFFGTFGDGEPVDDLPGWADETMRKLAYRIRSDDADARAYAERLVRGVGQNQEAIDAKISSISANWRLERMSVVDRNLLRLATFEMLFMDDEVPRRVALNEVIELAKQFGTKESSSFVNGIADRIGK